MCEYVAFARILWRQQNANKYPEVAYVVLCRGVCVCVAKQLLQLSEITITLILKACAATPMWESKVRWKFDGKQAV